jgi:fructosamine-3-kinase
MPLSFLQPVFDDCKLNITHYEAVEGGDINRCYCLYGAQKKYFLKVNNAFSYPKMFEQEAAGLNALRNSSILFVPEVINCGVVHQQQYLLLEWITTGKSAANFWECFGNAMALLHQKPQPYFGWKEDNYIGSLIQKNTKHHSWNSFYTECRIMPLVRELFDTANFSKQDVSAAELFCQQLEQLFQGEPAALLHGDLWSGNFMIAANGTAAVFDPAVYYGHREMDIGMTKLFGGFDQRFYAAYNEVYPLENNWKQRLSFTQLYPLLVHAVLFGGHYIQSARSIIQSL